ncbi:MAG: radical SAM protein, partial [Armatimonadota bacterium]
MKTHVGEKISRREFLRRCAGYGLALGGMMFFGDPNGVETVTQSLFGAAGLSNQEASYYRRLAGGAVQCMLCPNNCTLHKGQVGICRVRENEGGRLYTRVYGYTARVRGDAMEKSPFYHFLPGTSTVSLGTVGCNLRCLYCQNWQITQVRPQDLD